MSLDFGIIQKRYKGEKYEELTWENAHILWKNCYRVKEIFSETIDFNNTYSVDIIPVLIKKLSDELQKVDFNDINKIDNYSVSKILCAIEDLSKILKDALWEYSQGVEYEYRIFDGF